MVVKDTSCGVSSSGFRSGSVIQEFCDPGQTTRLSYLYNGDNRTKDMMDTCDNARKV